MAYTFYWHSRENLKILKKKFCTGLCHATQLVCHFQAEILYLLDLQYKCDDLYLELSP